MDRPRLADLCCRAGGAARGYQRAGFYVVGVDIEPQPNYAGDEFVQTDALTFSLHGFQAVHGSPPCQAFTRVRNTGCVGDYPDIVAPMREMFIASGLPYVIENVEGAPLIDPLTLCGTSFGLAAEGFEIRRHRLFETNFPAMALPCSHLYPALPVFGHGPNGDFYKRHGSCRISNEARNRAMGIDWMTRDEVAEAIPPAFTEHLGVYLMAEVRARAASAA